ncbi:DUF5811 family protein [Halospeciosus flavus]|uniref:DUF5811 family protein n=1 Tax=Halospeciosus flavus TaxID=3032283 RepID=A0ABD5Z837_9EURY|nr:DUF5811 family protein [Halospeciosus flavus]
MNGNTPYAGVSGVDTGGDDAPEITTAQRKALQASIGAIAARTRDFLPDEYVVGSEVSTGSEGPRVTVAVRPPVGNPVSAGFEPNFDGEDDDDLIPDAERDEVARGLAASAALQVKGAVGDGDVTPTAK